MEHCVEESFFDRLGMPQGLITHKTTLIPNPHRVVVRAYCNISR